MIEIELPNLSDRPFQSRRKRCLLKYLKDDGLMYRAMTKHFKVIRKMFVL